MYFSNSLSQIILWIRILGFVFHSVIYNNSRYNEYHDKLLESYIIDAISKSNDEYENDKIKDDEFIEEIKKSECESFDSVGLGVDYRLENENISGSAVLFKDALINASFFRKV
jgi:hypothetical protein